MSATLSEGKEMYYIASSCVSVMLFVAAGVIVLLEALHLCDDIIGSHFI